MPRRKSDPQRYPTYEPPAKKLCQDGGYNLRSHTSTVETPSLPQNSSLEPTVEVSVDILQPIPDETIPEPDGPVLPTTFNVERLHARQMATIDRITPSGDTSDYGVFLHDVQHLIGPIVLSEVDRQKGVKFHMAAHITMHDVNDPTKTQPLYLATKAKRMILADNLEEDLSLECTKISKKIEEYIDRGSGWVVDHLDFFEVYTNRYRPLKGNSFIPTPRHLANKKAIINVQNSDNKCFMWSILAHIHRIDDNARRVTHYEPFENDLNFDGIEFPVNLDSITRFEELNNLAVNVFAYETDLYPLRNTRQRDKPEDVINLLLLTDGEKQHYCLIKDLNKLLFDQTKHKERKNFCVFCLMHFTTMETLEKHVAQCQTGEVRIEMPEETTLKFKNFNRQMWAPLMITADFECFNKPVATCKPDPAAPELNQSYTMLKTSHEPNSYGAVSVRNCGCKPIDFTDFKIYRGKDPVDNFLEHILKVCKEYQRNIDYPKPLDMKPADDCKFDASTICHICKKKLGSDRVRDHCHTCGEFRGAAHSFCNLEYKSNRDVPVVFHNLQRYDAHLIMQRMGKFCNANNFSLWCVPKTVERYLTFAVRVPWRSADNKLISFNIKFIDSCQFLQASLSSLVDMLAESGDSKFHAMKKFFPDIELRKLLLRKNAYPYEWLTEWDKFDVTQLPPPETFYSTLEMKVIEPEIYEHCQTVWKAANCKTFGDYNDVYLKCDVLQLADVFQSFREMCKTNYDLDPAHYISLPSFSWDACLKMTRIELELLQDPEDYQFCEAGMRGGVAVISGRYAKANNPYMGEQYDPKEPNSYILYLDANNLYGWAMSQSMPVERFTWVEDLDQFTENFVLETSADADTTRIYEVDLDYPIELHDLHNDYPLAPESILIGNEMLSAYSLDLQKRLEKSCVAQRKLAPNLNNKRNYILHERLLKFYLQHGLKLKKVHRAMEFTQRPWLKTYIDFNTAKRTASKTKFEQDFFKLLNNAVFGKSMENVRKYKDIQIVTTQKKLDKLVAKPCYHSNTLLADELWAVSMDKQKIVLNKPVYSGFSILDISKEIMYRFHYDYIKPKYNSNAGLLFTDTDSLCYHIKTDDVFKDMLADKDEWFDCSTYPKDHILYDPTNKKVIGKMKDEFTGDEMPIEFVGLRAKMYSVKCLKGGKKVAKGVCKRVIEKKICHNDYVEALKGVAEQRAKAYRIQSFKHNVYSVEQVKTSLSCYDDKRHILPDGQTTLAHGHYKCDVQNAVDDTMSIGCSE